MREIVSRRSLLSKEFDIGNGRRRIIISHQPQYFVRDGRLVEFDMTPKQVGRLLEVSDVPYRLRLDPDVPAYLYMSESGRYVEAELIEAGGNAVKAGKAEQVGSRLRWPAIALDTTLVLHPLHHGVSALLVLHSASAPRRWKWRVRGNKDLLLPPKGHDANGQRVELDHQYDGDILTIEWTGRVTSQEQLRRGESWADDIAWPVVIDPTINEAVSEGADDVYSQWSRSGSNWVQASWSASDTVLAAGHVVDPLRDLCSGVRFQGVDIDQGTPILSAVLRLQSLAASGSPSIDIYGDDVDDAPTWDKTNSNVRTHVTKTTATTNVTTFESYPNWNEFDVTAIVQEIVDRPGWSSGNDMRFGLFNALDALSASVDARMRFSSWNLYQFPTGFGAFAPELVIEVEGGATVAPKMMHYRRLRI